MTMVELAGTYKSTELISWPYSLLNRDFSVQTGMFQLERFFVLTNEHYPKGWIEGRHSPRSKDAGVQVSDICIGMGRSL